MAIQWFPGHMNAARKKAAETMETTDLVIEVLDGRLPGASSNPMVEQLRLHRQRPCLKILNKSDLADPVATKQWIDFYNSQKGVNAIALSCRNPAEVAKIPGICQKIIPHRTGPGNGQNNDHGNSQCGQVNADEYAVETACGSCG